MVIAADTSFLFSLYGNDEHSSEAIRLLRARSCALSLTILNEFELANALRFSEYKSFLPPGSAASYWDNFLEDKRHGRVTTLQSNLSEVLEEAMRLSGRWTLKNGHRSFDILHVASAVLMQASQFLTFDKNQARLAGKAGMQVPLQERGG